MSLCFVLRGNYVIFFFTFLVKILYLGCAYVYHRMCITLCDIHFMGLYEIIGYWDHFCLVFLLSFWKMFFLVFSFFFLLLLLLLLVMLRLVDLRIEIDVRMHRRFSAINHVRFFAKKCTWDTEQRNETERERKKEIRYVIFFC